MPIGKIIVFGVLCAMFGDVISLGVSVMFANRSNPFKVVLSIIVSALAVIVTALLLFA
jgi:hypothetical protein